MKVSLLLNIMSGLFFAAFSQSGSSVFYTSPYKSISYSSSDITSSSPTFTVAESAVLTLSVKNINAKLREAAQVNLYNADRTSLLSTLITDSSGQVVFSGLSDGTYHYDVFYSGLSSTPLANNTEYWGSGEITIIGSSQAVIFTRTQPYISAEANFSPDILNSGQSISASFTIKNILSYSVDSYVAVWVDRDKESSWDYTRNIPAKTISSGNTSVFPFSVTPNQTGTYYYYAFVYTKVNGSYIVTDQYSWTQAFNVEDSFGNINIGLSDHNNVKTWSGNKILRYDQSDNLIDSMFTDINGQASWVNILEGTYRFEGYNTTLKTLWGDDLYWGSKQGNVTAGSTTTLNIIQSEPYIESVAITGTVFGPGSTVHVEVNVTNPDTVAKTCMAMIRIDQDKQPVYDFESGSSDSLILPPGRTSVFGFDWTIPVNTFPGTFYIATRVQTLYDNGFINSDATNWNDSIKNENSTISQIQWSGFTWNVKDGAELGPGPNDWLANSSVVWVDSEDNLHLKIRKIGSKWYCSSINAKPLLGYGEYTFQVSTDVEDLDQNVVLGLFIYETDIREIDIEFSRWSDPLSQAGWYNVQPSGPSSHHGFDLNLSDKFSTHKFRWRPSEVFFQSYHGHYPYLPEKEQLISEWAYTGSQIPPAGNERLILNLWLFRGNPPSDLKEVEVVIKSVTFRKVGDLTVQVQNIDQASFPAPGANGIVKLYNNENTLISTKQTDQTGSVTFAGIPVGSGYYYQVFHRPANSVSIYGQEYWGLAADIQVADGQTISSIFRRNQPYTGTVNVFNGSIDVTGQLVEPNTSLRIEQQIVNPSTQEQLVIGSVMLDRDTNEPYDFHLSEGNLIPIPANSSITQIRTITPTEKGHYYFGGGVQTLLNNDTLVCDGGQWLTLPFFTVSPSFNLILISDAEQKVTQNSTANWFINLKNTGSVNDDFSLKSDKGSFFYQGNPIAKTPVLLPNEEINLEFRFNSEMIEPATSGKIKISVLSNNDPTREKGFDVSYTIILSALVLTTSDITAITYTTATSGGTITADGGTTILTKGICWSTTAYPTIFLDTKTTEGSGSDPFLSTISGLTSGTTYHVRAYAINPVSAAYGNDVVFTTKVNNQPVANAGVNQSASEGTLIILDGTNSSDPDNNSLTYLWTAPAGITLSSTTASKPTFTAPEIKNDTILNFSLIVNDGLLNSLSSLVKISVINVIQTSAEGLPPGGIKLYPNPTTGIFKIDGMQSDVETILEVYAIDGKLIMRKICNSATCEIDISKQVSGTYLVVVNKQSIEIVKE